MNKIKLCFSASQWVIIFITSLLFSAFTVHAQMPISILTPDFSSSAGWQLNGNAVTTNIPGYLRLTQNDRNLAGSAFWKKKIALAADFSFSVYFTFKMTPGTRADGLTFCIQQAFNNAGGIGEGIGYANIPGKSIAVEYDTFRNAPDPNNNHIALNQNGLMHGQPNYPYVNALPYVQSSPGLDLADGQMKYNWIDYNGSTNTLEVRISTTGTRPTDPVLSINNLNLSEIMPNPDVFFGFTAATGGEFEEHAIYTVYATNSYSPFPSNPDPSDFIQGIANVDLLSSNSITCTNETAQIAITATDKDNQPLSGRNLNLMIDDGVATLSALNVITDTNGQAFVTLSNVNSPRVIIRAYDPVAGAYGTVDVDASTNYAALVADFEVLNETNLCSSESILLKNKSYMIGLGTISRLEWYLDYVNQPSQVIVDNNPQADEIYTFNYPDFTGSAAKNYSVRLVAYADGVCILPEKTKIITIKSAPKVLFDPLLAVCTETSPFQITQASEVKGAIGTYTYSGPGVTALGWFNPKTAGPGTHTINYVFSSTNGCADSLTQEIKVYANPTLYAGRDTTLILGQSLQLNALASGTNLVYRWTPAIGLSRDDIPNPVVSPLEDTNYTLTVSADGGCEIADNVFIRVLELPEIPNAFSPNGDGKNEVWNIKNLQKYEQALLQVFDRYGQQVFQTRGYQIPWDGRFKGADLPMATYYYIINLGFGIKPISGSITLLR